MENSFWKCVGTTDIKASSESVEMKTYKNILICHYCALVSENQEISQPLVV